MAATGQTQVATNRSDTQGLRARAEPVVRNVAAIRDRTKLGSATEPMGQMGKMWTV